MINLTYADHAWEQTAALLAIDSHQGEHLLGVCPLPGRESQAWAEPRNQGHAWVGPHPIPMYAIEVDS